MIIDSAFKPAWWLSNAHAQTVFPTLIRRVKPPIDKMERFELPDGDFIDLGWAVDGLGAETPLVALLHGLGGGIHSSYVAGLLRAFNQHGWRAVLMLFRGASEELNRFPRVYHSGDTRDLACFLEALTQREPQSKKAVVGVSLGGNVLLKWLGEQGQQSLVHTAVAVSVPFQLRLAADRLNQGFSRLYQSYLLKQMRHVFRRKLEKHDNMPSSLNEMESFRCFWTFDEYVTAPLNGFPNVHAYYREASSRQYLQNIATPTLIIHALDDPFMTPDVLPKPDDLSKDVLLELSHKGGHVGFITGNVPGIPTYWLEQRIPEYLQPHFTDVSYS